MMCEVMGKSRDAYYKRQKRLEIETDSRADVLSLVGEVRVDEPRTGTRKVHARIAPQLVGG